jgi:hypothetical protein
VGAADTSRLKLNLILTPARSAQIRLKSIFFAYLVRLPDLVGKSGKPTAAASAVESGKLLGN